MESIEFYYDSTDDVSRDGDLAVLCVPSVEDQTYMLGLPALTGVSESGGYPTAGLTVAEAERLREHLEAFVLSASTRN